MFSSIESGKQWNENFRGTNWGGKHQEAMFGKYTSASYWKKHKHLGPKVNEELWKHSIIVNSFFYQITTAPFGHRKQCLPERGTSMNLVTYVGLGIW